jgi:Fe-S-cluster containining protein
MGQMAQSTGSLPTSSATLRFSVGDLRIVHEVSVPAVEVTAAEIVPALQGVVNAVVDAAERSAVASGAAISCRKGCGACCRQLVPISRSEGERLLALVRSMPAGRRARIEKRLAEAAARIERAGLASPAGRSDREMSAAYFALGMACPFLEEESCSIHAERPLVCREYLVTSPAELCAGAAQEGVTPVAVPKFSAAAHKLEDESDGWFPLALLANSRRTRPRQPAVRRSGLEWVQRFLKGLTGKQP